MYVTWFETGSKSIGFDKVDFNNWVIENKGRGGKRPNNGGTSM